MATIKPRRGSSYPASGLSENELAVDATNRRVYLGSAGGSGITVASHITDYVSSVNSATGAITNVALTNTAQSFSGLQTFTTGISAAGATFPNNGKVVFNGGGFVDASGGLLYLGQNSLRTAIGDVNATSNGTYILLRDSTSQLDIINPYNTVRIGDPDIISGGAFLLINNSTGNITISPTPGAKATSSSLIEALGGITAAGATFSNTVNLQKGLRVNGSIGSTNYALTTNGAGTISWSPVVNTINGESGGIIGVATYTGTSPFTTNQNFAAGISANGGSTFNNAILVVTNSTSGVDPLYVQHNTNNGLKISSTGQGRQGSIRLGNSTSSGFNTYITQTDGTLTVYNGISAGSGTITMAIGITGGVTISPTINGATFNQIIRSTSGISASGAITGGSWMFAQDGYRIGSSAVSAKTGTTYTFGAADDGKIFTSSNAATQTFTIPTGLPIGFNCTVIQIGTGGVAITGASGVTLNSYNSKYNLLGQHASASIVSYTTNVFNLSGGLT